MSEYGDFLQNGQQKESNRDLTKAETFQREEMSVSLEENHIGNMTETVRKAASAREMDKRLREAFSVKERTGIRFEDKGAMQEPEAGFVTLEKSWALDSTRDSVRLKALKEQINRYHQAEDDAKLPALRTLVRACDGYTKSKTGAQKYGKGYKKLQEVRNVRTEAEQKISELHGETEKQKDHHIVSRFFQRLFDDPFAGEEN